MYIYLYMDIYIYTYIHIYIYTYTRSKHRLKCRAAPDLPSSPCSTLHPTALGRARPDAKTDLFQRPLSHVQNTSRCNRFETQAINSKHRSVDATSAPTPLLPAAPDLTEKQSRVKTPVCVILEWMSISAHRHGFTTHPTPHTVEYDCFIKRQLASRT